VPPTTTKSTAEVAVDVGILYAAPIGTTEPTGASSVLDTAWREVGYTEDGSKFTTEVDAQEVVVEELLDPIRYVNVKRTSKLAFVMAQSSARNLQLALNQGAAGTAVGGQAIAPVTSSSEVRVMLLWQSEATGANQSRLIARQAYNSGNIEMTLQQAPDKHKIPVEFNLEKPTSLEAFTFYPNNSGIF
jgi:hypothetical protein